MKEIKQIVKNLLVEDVLVSPTRSELNVRL